MTLRGIQFQYFESNYSYKKNSFHNILLEIFLRKPCSVFATSEMEVYNKIKQRYQNMVVIKFKKIRIRKLFLL